MPEQFVLRFFEADHDRLDIIYRDFKRNLMRNKTKAVWLFHLFQQGLLKHIEWEEELLFPIFENKSGLTEGGPTFVMRSEHGQIMQLLNSIELRLSKDESVEKSCQELEHILSAHNHKEEQILYPSIDNFISDHEVTELCVKMEQWYRENQHTT